VVDDAAEPTNEPVPTEDDAEVSDDSDAGGDTEDPGGGAAFSDVPVPIARFTAAGPGDANTIAPSCAPDIELDNSEMYRLTMPDGWSWKGFSGGTGWDEISLRAGDDADMRVIEVATQSELPPDIVIGDPTGTEIDLDGAAVPLVDIELEGRTGYGFVDLAYLEPFPIGPGAALGTVALTSDADGRPTIDEAVALLSTVRVERCEAVSLSQIYGPNAGVHLVPRFEPDPLGKQYPDQRQPSYEPGVSPLAQYSLEQLGYLMPVSADIAACAAERAATLADDPIGYLKVLRPTGTGWVEFDELIAGC